MNRVKDGFYSKPREAENAASISSASTPTQRSPRHTIHSRVVSMMDDLASIPEFEESTSRNPPFGHDPEAALLGQPGPDQWLNSPSLFRRITTRLANPKALTSGVLGPPIRLASLRSRGGSRRSEYENLDDVDGGREMESIPVDLSVLDGLGVEITESVPAPGPSWYDQNTAYESPRPDDGKPKFQSFVRRRHVGDGLIVGAQLKRDPSIRVPDTPVAIAEEVQRNRTVRNTAQNIAEQRNMIVSVSEPVDLSFLEGHVMRTDTHQSFDAMLNRTVTTADAPQSYFFPHDPDTPNWRPLTMSSLFTVFLSLGAFALAGSQEYLLQKSNRRAAQKSGLLHFNQVDELSVGVFFVWKYLPTMITIIYAVLFSVMDFDIRRLEPFYQLSRPQGSPASESLNVDHLTMFQYFVPFKALRLRQWTVFLSTIGNIIASTASPALQNPSVNFTNNTACILSNTTAVRCENYPVSKYVVLISPVWSRLLSASYVIVGLIAATLLFQLRRKSGLLADPKGIAGIASMATKSHILREFKDSDLMTQKELSKRLAHRQFILHKSSIWQGRWDAEQEPPRENNNEVTSPNPPMLRLSVGVPFIIVQIFCLVAVPIISLSKANIIPNAAPWLPILIATILKQVWSTFEADVRLMEPFYRLSLGRASPENSLTLDYQATIYGFMPFKAAYNGHWLLCIVGVSSVALDVLSVTVSSFSIQAASFYNPPAKSPASGSPNTDPDTSVGDETKISFFVSVVLSMAILTFVIFTSMLVYARRRHPFLPREPSTIASVLAFIYASNMLEDFIDTERLTNKQMEEKLKRIGKEYALGWFKGRDGKIHCAIDQEPMRSRYVHGKPYAQAVAGPHETYYS